MPFSKDDVRRATEVLESLAEELKTPADAHHRLAVITMLRVLKTQLFAALVDIYEDYEGTIQETAPPPPPPNLEEIFGMLKIQQRVQQHHVPFEGSGMSPAHSHRDVGVSPFSTPPGSISELQQSMHGFHVLPCKDDREEQPIHQAPRSSSLCEPFGSEHEPIHVHTNTASTAAGEKKHIKPQSAYFDKKSDSATIPHIHVAKHNISNQEHRSPLSTRGLDAASSLPDISLNRNENTCMAVDSPTHSTSHISARRAHSRSGSRSSNVQSSHDFGISHEEFYDTYDEDTFNFRDEDYYSSDNHLGGSYDGDMGNVMQYQTDSSIKGGSEKGSSGAVSGAHGAVSGEANGTYVPEDGCLRWEDFKRLDAQVSGGESVGILNRLLASSATELTGSTDTTSNGAQSVQRDQRKEKQEDEGFYSPSHQVKGHSRSKELFRSYLPTEPRMVELFKGDQGFGFSLVGSTETGSYVTGILPGGPCDGVLYRGDQIVMINNLKIDKMSYVKTAQLFKSIPTASSVMLMVKHNKKGLEELEAHLID